MPSSYEIRERVLEMRSLTLDEIAEQAIERDNEIDALKERVSELEQEVRDLEHRVIEERD